MTADNTFVRDTKSARNGSREKFWMRLDNAAKIYPAVQDEELTAVFRLTCVLKKPVKIGPLLKAIELLENRFPYYKVKPKKGFFWYYLEFHDEPIPLKPDMAIPCRAFAKDDLIFRVLVRENRLSVEFSHILTDGGGGFEFLKSLLLTYFDKCCISVPDHVTALKPDEDPSREEFEDAFSAHFQENIPSPKKKPKSFHLPFALNNPPRFNVLVAKLSLADISAKSKMYKVTITAYLVAVYLHSLQSIYNRLSGFKRRRERKIFRVQVPVNLRKIYPSKTMRNFSLFVTPEIDLALGQYSFEEIIKTVHHIMQLETDKKLINKIIARNVGAERNIWLKNTPLFIKSLILNLTYSIAGTSRYSGVITNLGKVTFGEVDNLIDHFVFVPPPPNKALKVNCGVLGFDNNLVIAFGNITQSKEFEREFFRFLVSQGISVKILKN
ncbi:hypothetical protein [Chryseosolibacter indicus]|uniref:Alcohol acetyltransferase n=1 Tax=Chryseosolibacter indicus TaxID=2782351 RepID=A0ABS5VZR6_9BACT|nr:hypothetical protein [Chryseosolibacter indicus]MBT1706355.1 hypothetical protein [Chryseosolibacter indicus]